jgi:hypothetical protein
MSDQIDGIKISVTLPSETVADIKELSIRLGVTPRELLRGAESMEKHLDNVERNDGKISIQTADDKLKLITRK